MGNDGTPHTLRWNGRDYPVGEPCPAVVDRIEKHVIRAALDGLEEAKGAMTPAEQRRADDALQAAIRTRQHRPGGALWAAEMAADGGVRGLVLMLWSCMAEAHEGKDRPPPTPDDVWAMYHEANAEVLAAAALVLPDFTRRAGERRKLPPAAIAAEVARAVVRAAGVLETCREPSPSTPT
jgi:hypothetical protein